MSHVKPIILSCLIGLTVNCSKEKKEESTPSKTNNTTEPDNTAGTVAISTNGLAIVYPEGLSVSAFPLGIDPSPGVAAVGTVALETAELTSKNFSLADCTNLPPPPQPIPPECQNQNPPPPNSDPSNPDPNAAGNFSTYDKHPKEVLEENQKRLSGEGDCFSTNIIHALSFSDKTVDACYGFDYGIVSGNALGSIDQGKVNNIIPTVTDQSLAGIKAAFQAESTLIAPQNPEACMVTTGRKLVNAAAARVNGALRVVEGMLCQAKKNGDEELPAIGATKDLSSTFAAFTNVIVTKAEITRLEDVSGRSMYKTSIILKLNDSKNPNSKDINMTLKHSPGLDGNGSYDGVLMTEGEVLDDQNQDAYAEVSSISYSKSGTTVDDQKLKIEIRETNFNKSKLPGPYFDDDGRIDLNLGANAAGDYGPGNQNDYVKGISYFTFDINPSSYAGNIAFWRNPGGGYTEKARGFVYETKQNSDGTLNGCSFTGADASSIRASIAKKTSLAPTGCYTPQISNGACGNANDNVGPQVFKQCFKQNTEGLYVVDTSITTGADGIDTLKYGTDTFTVPKVDITSPNKSE